MSFLLSFLFIFIFLLDRFFLLCLLLGFLFLSLFFLFFFIIIFITILLDFRRRSILLVLFEITIHIFHPVSFRIYPFNNIVPFFFNLTDSSYSYLFFHLYELVCLCFLLLPKSIIIIFFFWSFNENLYISLI